MNRTIRTVTLAAGIAALLVAGTARARAQQGMPPLPKPGPEHEVLKADVGVWDAVVEASLSRFRPIMLTALSTVLGMIPIAPTVFWGSMAYAIMGGLLVASLLTLVFLPTLYVTWYGGKARRPYETHRGVEAPAT